MKSNFLDSQDDGEPAPLYDSSKMGGAPGQIDNEKVRLIQAKEII